MYALCSGGDSPRLVLYFLVQAGWDSQSTRQGFESLFAQGIVLEGVLLQLVQPHCDTPGVHVGHVICEEA